MSGSNSVGHATSGSPVTEFWSAPESGGPSNGLPQVVSDEAFIAMSEENKRKVIEYTMEWSAKNPDKVPTPTKEDLLYALEHGSKPILNKLDEIAEVTRSFDLAIDNVLDRLEALEKRLDEISEIVDDFDEDIDALFAQARFDSEPVANNGMKPQSLAERFGGK